MSEHRLIFGEPDPTITRVELGERMAIWRDVEGHWRFEHVCERFPDEREPDGEFVKLIAPTLDRHTVSPDGRSVSPSILCLGCQLHGFVTDGTWRSC